MFAPKVPRRQADRLRHRAFGPAAQRSAEQSALKQGIGNQATLRFLSQQNESPSGKRSSPSLQTKLEVGSPDSPLEREADRIAERVMSASCDKATVSSGPPQVGRSCTACEDMEEQGTSSSEHSDGSEAPDHVKDVVRASGEPLDEATRAYFEPRFGQDFSEVRVHTDSGAADSAKQLLSRAYAIGHDIVFASGQFTPGTANGRHLIAHELTHVVQQSQGRTAHLQRQPDQSGPDEDYRTKIVTYSQIEMHVRNAIAHPTWQRREGRAAFNANPNAARASMYGTHFRDDQDRLSFALGVFESALAISGSVDPVELFGTMMTYESAVQRDNADIIVHDRPTETERVQLSALRVAQSLRREVAREHRLADRTPATRAERYNENLKRLGKSPSYPSLLLDPDPALLTKEEAIAEWRARAEKELDDCDRDNVQPDPRDRCRLKVKEKYMSKEYMEESFEATRAAWNNGAYIETIKNSGPFALLGRGAGRGIGYFAGGKEDEYEAWGALGGGALDIAGVIWAGSREWARFNAYNASGGLEVGMGEFVDMTNAPMAETGWAMPGRPATGPAVRAENFWDTVMEPVAPENSAFQGFEPSQPLASSAFEPLRNPPPKDFREALNRIDISKLDPTLVESLRQQYRNGYSLRPNAALKTEDDYVRFRGGQISKQWEKPAGEPGEFQLGPALGRAHEEEWSAESASPTNPGGNDGGRFKTPWANVEPDFIPSVTGGNQVFTRTPGDLTMEDSNAVWEAALRTGWRPLLIADSKHFQSGVHGITDQIRGFIWLASFSESRTFVIIGREGDRVTQDVTDFANQYGVTVRIMPFGR